MSILLFALAIFVVILALWAIGSFVQDARMRNVLYIFVIAALIIWFLSAVFGVSLLNLRI